MQLARIEEQIAGYWQELRNGRALPARSEVDPRGLEGVLEHMFIIERTGDRKARFRVAGMHLNHLMGMEVRGMAVTSLFNLETRGEAARAFEQVFGLPACIRLDLAGQPGRIGAYPLLGPHGDIDRAMGYVVVEGLLADHATPQRLDVGLVEVLPVGPDHAAYGDQPGQSVAGFAEPASAFRNTGYRRPALRVIRNDDDRRD